MLNVKRCVTFVIKTLSKLSVLVQTMISKPWCWSTWPKGTSEKWLYSVDHCLDIQQILNIMIDVSWALQYLHYGCSAPIVGCDLKPSNVLLEDVVAHLNDCGIAKLLGGDSTTQIHSFNDRIHCTRLFFAHCCILFSTFFYLSPFPLFRLQVFSFFIGS